MNFPAELKYTKDHEWVKMLDDTTALVGISDFAQSELSPVTGSVAEVNEELDDSPELLNSDPYGAWIMKIENITDFSELLSAEEYEAFTKEEH